MQKPDTICNFRSFFSSPFQTISAADHHQGSLTGVMGVLLHALACNQSITVLQNVLATQRSLVFKVSIAGQSGLCLENCGICNQSITVLQNVLATQRSLVFKDRGTLP